MWLVKTEPDTYSFDDLEREGRTTWDGVTNPVALKNLAAMKAGDRVVVYHTGGQKCAVGTARVARTAYPDPNAGDPRRLVVDLEAGARFAREVTLAEIKAHREFTASPLVRQGRLSVVPLTNAQWAFLTGTAR